ncbi:DUF885 domain-containing protein [Pseudonocardia oroxyli]|uniref:DUF885 domain-containing protein n=1 Tax=Pseudonocardia oroxyli TaxID=366584 RepID=A0A1G7QBZ8_PSEOR|nr:DUF885 domain-containing protein [Pseudonocardia oroxyli]SDF96024.1 hypothetical protein SAMN05216377_10831 [Pseudonocardia oroxyli]
MAGSVTGMRAGRATVTVVARDIALLALRLDRVRPGLIESWTGDPALRRHVRDEPRPALRELAAAAERLRRTLEYVDLPPVRRAFLAGELQALAYAARETGGTVAEEIRETYGVVVRPGDPDRYREAHRRVAELLPGPGPLAARLAALRSADEVPPPQRARAVRALAAALRDRCRNVVELPGDEGVRIELVEGRPWSGFTRYLGAGRSVARFSADAPLRAGQLARLVAHETYPGHHVEHLHRAAARDPERALSLTHGPRALVVEGAADLALDAVVGPGWGPWAADVLADAGVHTDGALAEALDAAMLPLQHVRLDAALRNDPDAARDHLRRWLLLDDARTERVMRFVTDPRWRAYTATYVIGFPLVRAFWAGHAPRFRRLLAEPLTPAALVPPAPPGSAARPSPERGLTATDGVDHAMSGRPFC